MNLVQFAGISVIVYAGLIAGMVIAWMAQEEIKPGKRYFILMHDILVAAIAYLVLESLKIHPLISLITPIIVLCALVYHQNACTKSPFIYLVLGIALALSSSSRLFLPVASLIFFYGFLIGSLQIDLKRRNYLAILAKNLVFFAGIIVFRVV